jgi:hypothetical protein
MQLCKVVEVVPCYKGWSDKRLPANSVLDSVHNFIGVQHRDITALVDGRYKRLELELNKLHMMESFETELARIICQVIGPGLLEGLHYLDVLAQVNCEWVPYGQYDAEENFHSAEDVDGVIGAWDRHFVFQQDLGIG